jgi:hypothetical protein
MWIFKGQCSETKHCPSSEILRQEAA